MKKKRRITSFLLAFTIIFSLSFTEVFIPLNNIVLAREYSESELQIGNTYEGFVFKEERVLQENEGTARIFEHEKSGARLFQLKNSDENKLFSIGFRTPARDNKGTSHILEHCVLVGGSEKYPVKQLFKELLQVSISKDLNGFTAPDMTVFPYSTTNEKEFMNLMDVYLNMVFKPRFYDDEKIFHEEAWHYEINNEDEDLRYNGVVYNEMKGAMSTVDSMLYTSIMKSIYPETNYKYISGGDPEEITDLTFEELKNFHSEYYHPSNSYIFVYGNTDIMDKLKLLNKNYLKDYEKKEINSRVQEQMTFKLQRNNKFEYVLSKEESIENKSVLTLNYVIGKSDDEELTTAFKLINYILFNNPSSPLIKTLNKVGFTSVSGVFSTSQYQPFLSVIAANTEGDKAELYKDVFDGTLRGIVKEGIDKELIKSTINRLELEMKENIGYSSKTGAMYNRAVLNKWIYDGNPMEIFNSEDIVNCLKKALESNYLESLIEEYILKNPHSSLNVLAPTKEDNSRGKEEEKLNKVKEQLTSKEIEELITYNKELKEWQNKEESKENLDTIPTLSLEDLKPKIEKVPLEIQEKNDYKILYHNMDTRGVAASTFYFDASTVNQEKIPYITLLSQLLGNMDTKNYNVHEVQKKELEYCKGVQYNSLNFISSKDNNEYSPKLGISTLVLSKNIDEVLELIGEIIENTDFSKEDLLKQNIFGIKCDMENYVANNPQVVAIGRNTSYFSQGRAYSEVLRGIYYKEFIDDLYKNFDSKKDEIIKSLDEVSRSVFNKNNLTISVTSDEKTYKIYKKNLDKVLDVLEKEKLEKSEYNFQMEHNNEAFYIASNVQYNSQGFSFKNKGLEYNGSMLVLQNILDLDYLWKNIRVTGGAYGYNILMDRCGDIAIVSYRDPKVRETYEIYENIPEYLENLQISEEDFEKYKISSLYKYYRPSNLYEKVTMSDRNYFTGLSDEDREKELNEILNCKLEDIKKYSTVFQNGLKEYNRTTIGREEDIRENSDLFEKITLLTFK